MYTRAAFKKMFGSTFQKHGFRTLTSWLAEPAIACGCRCYTDRSVEIGLGINQHD